jgi:hypothetical protein
MPLKLVIRKKQKPVSAFKTRKRVLEGLRAAAVTIWGENVKSLPTSTLVYQQAVMQAEPTKSGKARRFYPSANAVLNHFESMNHAWWTVGYEVETISTRKGGLKLVTPEIHEKLEYIYQFQNIKKAERPTDAPTVRQYADSLGLGRHTLCQYAAKQGWVEPKEPVWSRVELKLLDKYAHLSPVIIQKHFVAAGFKRTVTSVRLMRIRRNSHKGAPYYSASAASKLLGVDSYHFDRYLLLKFPDELKFEMKGDAKRGGQNGDTKLFHVDTLREFFCNHPEEIDLAKVDKIWFLWLITNGKVKMIAPSARLSLRGEGYRPGAAREHRKLKATASSAA